MCFFDLFKNKCVCKRWRARQIVQVCMCMCVCVSVCMSVLVCVCVMTFVWSNGQTDIWVKGRHISADSAGELACSLGALWPSTLSTGSSLSQGTARSYYIHSNVHEFYLHFCFFSLLFSMHKTFCHHFALYL